MVAWQNEFSVGNAHIDHQHEHIVRLVNALEIANASGEGGDTVDLVLPHLARFLRQHFEAEERLMASVGYPDLPLHHAQHAACQKRLDALVDRMSQGRTVLQEATEFLGQWLHAHLLTSDQSYATWVRNHPHEAAVWASSIAPELRAQAIA